jgi:hypothetical protein
LLALKKNFIPFQVCAEEVSNLKELSKLKEVNKLKEALTKRKSSGLFQQQVK